LAQKRWAIRMGEETSLTTAASSQQPGQFQEVEPPRQLTLAEKRFAIRMGQDDREAGCFSVAMDCHRSKESFNSGSPLGAPRPSFAETRFAMRMPEFAGIGVF